MGPCGTSPRFQHVNVFPLIAHVWLLRAEEKHLGAFVGPIQKLCEPIVQVGGPGQSRSSFGGLAFSGTVACMCGACFSAAEVAVHLLLPGNNRSSGCGHSEHAVLLAICGEVPLPVQPEGEDCSFFATAFVAFVGRHAVLCLFLIKDVGNIFQGLLNTNANVYKDGASKFARVWLHECYRVFSDRLVNASDQGELQGILEKAAGKHFGSIPKDDLFAQPLIMTSFVSAATGSERYYLLAKDMPSLKKVVEDKLTEYNETFAAMNLVLFDDAINHVCRICRITDNPCGHALLVGVGGSGKQSLAKLSTFINGQDLLSILVNQSYGTEALKLDLQEFYKRLSSSLALRMLS